MHRSGISSVLVVLCTLFLATAATAAPPPDLAETQAVVRQLQAQMELMRADIRRLKETVKRLEAALAGDPVGTKERRLDPVAEADAGRVMLLDDFEFTSPVDNHSAEIKALRSEAAEFRKKAEKNIDDADRLRLYPWWGGWNHSYAPSWWATDRQRRHDAEVLANQTARKLRKTAVGYDNEADDRIGAAKRLERADAKSCLMVLHGWDGSGPITLESNRDLRPTLRGKSKGVYLTWRGLPTSPSVWAVKSIKVVAKPDGFERRR